MVQTKGSVVKDLRSKNAKAKNLKSAPLGINMTELLEKNKKDKQDRKNRNKNVKKRKKRTDTLAIDNNAINDSKKK